MAHSRITGKGSRRTDTRVREERTWCVVPTFNNKATIRRIVTGCRTHLDNILVVDDGSTDADVGALLAGVDATIIQHESNRGKGQAILTALDFVRSRRGTHMITIDGDGQHFPRDLPKFLAAIQEDAAGLIVGVRNFTGNTVPSSSQFGRAFSNFWLRLESGEVLADSQSGFRAYPVQYISQLPLKSRHYDFEVEVLTRAVWAGLRLKSVDIDVWYPSDPDRRVTSFKPFLDNLRISLIHSRHVGRQLVPWPHKKLMKKEGQPRFLLWPRQFILSLIREHATPGGLAASAAVGVFFGVLPLISLHILVIAFITTRLNLNKVMALGIQNLCMPPFVPFACIELGHYLRYRKWLTEASMDTIFYQVTDRLYEWLLGSLLLAPLLAATAAVIVFHLALQSQQKKRRNRRIGSW